MVVLTANLWRTPGAWRCILSLMDAKRHLCLVQDALACRGGVDSFGAGGPAVSSHPKHKRREAPRSASRCIQIQSGNQPGIATLTRAQFSPRAEAFIESAPDEIKNHRDAYGVPHGLFATASSVVRLDRRAERACPR